MELDEGFAVLLAAGLALASALLSTLVSGIMTRRLSNQIQTRQDQNAKAIAELQRVIQMDIDHQAERHRFRHTIGQFTAEARLKAHVELGIRVTAAYRSKMASDNAEGVNKAEVHAERRATLHDAKNYYYDQRFFYSHRLGRAFESVTTQLAMPWFSDVEEGQKPLKKDYLEKALNDFFTTIREDLLLDELADSARRAIESSPDRRGASDVEIVAP